MRKTLQATIGLLVMTLVLTMAATPVHAYIYSYNWTAPLYRGYDSFFGTYVVAYEAGSTAQLFVRVYNDWYGYPSINVTAVKVSFDWNVNYTSNECPYVMLNGEYHSFMINFTVPQTNIASDMFAHSYMMYVEFAYDGSTSYWSYYPGESFAVYSVERADALDLQTELNAKFSYVPSFNSYEARLMLSEAQAERGTGDYMSGQGKFALAKTHYEAAADLFDQAFAIESNYTKAYDEYYSAYQEAQLNVTRLQAEATKTQADAALATADASMEQAEAAMIEANATQTQANAAVTLANASFNQSYAWFLFGIGFIIISIGALVYASRKPKIPKTP